MNYQVIYFSRKGSTKKIAETIASELNVQAENVKNATLTQEALVFLGSGCYGGKPAKEITKFIENNDFKSRNVVLFGTSGGGEGQEINEMENMLSAKNANIKGKFYCKGKFFLMNRERPNTEDLTEAQKFAQQMKL